MSPLRRSLHPLGPVGRVARADHQADGGRAHLAAQHPARLHLPHHWPVLRRVARWRRRRARWLLPGLH
eukprot:5786904-Prymnesium_polylepis.1